MQGSNRSLVSDPAANLGRWPIPRLLLLLGAGLVATFSGCAGQNMFLTNPLAPEYRQDRAGESSGPWQRLRQSLQPESQAFSELPLPELPAPRRRLSPPESIQQAGASTPNSPLASNQPQDSTAAARIEGVQLAQGMELDDPTELDSLVENSDVPVLVDFYADWCGPCKKQGKILESMNISPTQARVVKVDVDKHPQIAQRFGAQSIPTLVVFHEGRATYRQTGVHDAKQLSDLLELR